MTFEHDLAELFKHLKPARSLPPLPPAAQLPPGMPRPSQALSGYPAAPPAAQTPSAALGSIPGSGQAMLPGTIPPLSGSQSLPGVVCGVIDPNSPIAIFVDPRELRTRSISEDRRRDVPFPPPPPLPDSQPPGPCDWAEVELPNTGDACRDFVVIVRRLQVVVALLDLVNDEAGMDAMFVQYSYALRCVSARCAGMLGNQHSDLLNPELPLGQKATDRFKNLVRVADFLENGGARRV